MVQESRLGTREILLEVPEDRLQVPDSRLEVGFGCLRVSTDHVEVRAGRLRSPANRPVFRAKPGKVYEACLTVGGNSARVQRGSPAIKRPSLKNPFSMRGCLQRQDIGAWMRLMKEWTPQGDHGAVLNEPGVTERVGACWGKA